MKESLKNILINLGFSETKSTIHLFLLKEERAKVNEICKKLKF